MKGNLIGMGVGYTGVDKFKPKTYKGIQGFHKYWGKKPSDLMAYLVQSLSKEGDHVLDPFLGYGAIARECKLLGRKFTGIDINPAAVRLSKFMCELPNEFDLKAALISIKEKSKEMIEESYSINGSINVATHYLWEKNKMVEIWGRNGHKKCILKPSQRDFEIYTEYLDYKSKEMREIKTFNNNRISTIENMSLSDFFTPRALRNVDILLHEIKKFENVIVKESLLLALNASIGQMSKMVFVITSRGKVEVGSWVIGLWRPDRHFEINVWNCFERRVNKLIKTCYEIEKDNINVPVNTHDFIVGDSITAMKKIPDNTINLIITDPPHGDRIPYLELSELWNAVLNEPVNFEDEIIISNAGNRNKDKEDYDRRMSLVWSEAKRILKTGGHIVLLFNSRKKSDWLSMMSLLHDNLSENCIEYIGYFDCDYSAKSIVQDTRDGGMKSDFGLVFRLGQPSISQKEFTNYLEKLPGWSTYFPVELECKKWIS